MNTEEFTKTETNLFAKFLAWINKQFIAEQKEYKDAPTQDDVSEVENQIDNNKNSDTMEKEELVKKILIDILILKMREIYKINFFFK
jgi:hypothetical protein